LWELTIRDEIMRHDADNKESDEIFGNISFVEIKISNLINYSTNMLC